MDRIIPTKYRGVYDKAMKGRSLKTAVKCMCYECFGYTEVADNIKNCTDSGCPLYLTVHIKTSPINAARCAHRVVSGVKRKGWATEAG